MTPPAVVGYALGSALAAACASVLQHRGTHKVGRRHGTGMRLLLHLAANPAWLIGLLVAGVGLALHAIALGSGRLAVVQPLLVSGVLFALPASALLEGRHPSLREIRWAGALVVALSAFLLVANPQGGTDSADGAVLGLTTVAGTAVIVVAALVVRRARRYGAALMAIAAGLGYGITAALLKQTTAVAAGGIGAVFVDWPVYAMVAVGAFAIALNQLAYRAGPLAESLPALTVSDPASSIVIGALAFHEVVAHSALDVAVELASFVIMGLASARLSRRAAQPRDCPVDAREVDDKA